MLVIFSVCGSSEQERDWSVTKIDVSRTECLLTIHYMHPKNRADDVKRVPNINLFRLKCTLTNEIRYDSGQTHKGAIYIWRQYLASRFLYSN